MSYIENATINSMDTNLNQKKIKISKNKRLDINDIHLAKFDDYSFIVIQDSEGKVYVPGFVFAPYFPNEECDVFVNEIQNTKGQDIELIPPNTDFRIFTEISTVINPNYDFDFSQELSNSNNKDKYKINNINFNDLKKYADFAYHSFTCLNNQDKDTISESIDKIHELLDNDNDASLSSEVICAFMKIRTLTRPEDNLIFKAAYKY